MTDYAEPSVPVTGGAMPLLGFGTWQIDDADAPAAVSAALEAGYRHIDTATGYSNQRGVGKAIADSGLARDDVFVTTKLPPDNADRVRETIEESLEQLGLDHLDLWLVHWPPNGEARPDVWEQVVQARTDGLTRAVGVSNYSLAQIDELIQATGVTPAVNQIKWSPAEFDRAVADGLRERGVVLEGYSPFKASNLEDPTLVSIAQAHEVDTAQVIVAWHVAHEFVVIPKSSNPDRIRSNAAGATVTLSDDEVTQIDALGH
ncbi:aldo/keto reductase [Curtobacterium sp. MCLR17_007]|uniref:aldo/keto reductase n=1 Tax=Curtobacterium sp. MCLR17_007 TaxID=2175648 RepID=UPI001C64D8CC|nr:aldo/keto reductase [Curtobacterium sp. MCLR17_007]WIB61465.1 aldo/keto reductase [Curtobacterium sp. MCLR17_007]